MTVELSPRLADWLDPPPNPYTGDPSKWAWDRLGVHFWSLQREVADSVVRHRRTAVHSCHGAGKSLEAAVLVAWWLDVHPPGQAFVVTTAPTDAQVSAILWREIGRLHRRGNLDGRVTLDNQWYLGRELVAFGRKPADYTDVEQAKAAFQGIHARYVLVVLDEGAGIPAWLWEATAGLVTNDDARLLVIGNPDKPESEFARKCGPGSGYNVIHISAFDTPNFTGEKVPEELRHVLVTPTWVEERAAEWGEDSPLYISKVLGLFPQVSDDTLIHPGWVTDARNRELPGLGDGRYGVDVARSGQDESAIYYNRDGVIRATFVKTAIGDTMVLVGKVKNLIEPNHGKVPAVIDVIGVGAGVFDRAAEQGLAVVPFNSSESATDKTRFKNRRAEAWWAVRDLFRDGLIDLDEADDKLASQLMTIKWKVDSSGRIQIESKEDMKKRGVPSPDRADALMMSCVEESAVQPLTPPNQSTNLITAGLMGRSW